MEERRPAQVVEAIDLSKTDPPPPVRRNAFTFIEPNLD